MILEFTIENFRSIAQEQVVSLYCTGSLGWNLSNTIPLADTKFRILKSAGFYGANASGKTNVLRALWCLRRLVCSSYRFGENDRIPYYDPCLLSSDGQQSPTRFGIELTIPIEGVERRFLYLIAHTANEIESESLVAYSKNRKSILFNRKHGDTRDTIDLGSSLKGGDRRLAFFRNQSYLSVAGRNAGAPVVLRQIYQYFATRFNQVRLYEEGPLSLMEENIESGRLIRFVDVGISNVEKRIYESAQLSNELPPELPEAVKRRIIERIRTRYVFTHGVQSGKTAEIDLANESDGTQRLFRLFPQIVDTLVNGGVFIIDEIECGMHPLMAEVIVRLFNDPEVNVGQAQLVFTTHNSNLMSSDLLRRDQIWFTEKRNGQTICFSLDQFDKKLVTPNSPYCKWYLEGRFGALPSIDYSSLVHSIVAMRGNLHAKE